MAYCVLICFVCFVSFQMPITGGDSGITKQIARSGVGSAQNPLLFNHIFIMVMENKGFNETFNSPAWQSIISTSAWFKDMNGITHPSQPNYISIIAGSPLSCTDSSYFSTNEATIIDLLNRAGVS